MTKNTICLWFDKDAHEAARFYAATFPDSNVTAVHKAPGDFPGGKAGDELTVTAGCDRRFSTCRAKFANAVNFRGFPHIPGNDFVLKAPKAGDTLDGRPLFG